MLRLFTILFLSTLPFLSPTAMAQTLIAKNKGTGTMPVGELDTLDAVILCVHYNQRLQLDSLDADNIERSRMILQIGNRLSRYTNYTRLQSDSITHSVAVNGKIDLAQINDHLTRLRRAGDFSDAYKNHPIAGRLFYREMIDGGMSYVEGLHLFDWQLATDGKTTDILGYPCHRATTSFRGRNYTAWFTSEIPIDNGPWKFGGLPGLILKAEDDKGQFTFEATALYPVTWHSPITLPIWKKEIQITREKFNIARRRKKEAPMLTLTNSGKITSLPSGYGTDSKKLPYNPIELF